MGDYFDDDDLIGDYMEEEFDEPPPPAPTNGNEDDLLEEMMLDAEQNHQSQPKPPENPIENVNPPSNNLINNKNEGEREQEDDDVSSFCPPVETVEVISTRPNADTDLYSFERYTGSKNAWRRVEKPTEAFEAKQWKSRFSPDWKLNLNRSTKPKSPDAQLLVISRPTTRKTLLVGPGISRTPRMDRPSIPMTVSGSSRVHVQMRRQTKQLETTTTWRGMNLLSQGMHQLRRQGQEMKRQREKRQQKAKNKSKKQHEQHLWVDKHAPSVFSHLLSDEGTNRQVLKTLRAWDPFVFGRPAPSCITDSTTTNNNTASNRQIPAKQQQQNPNDKRPDVSSRVILLSGPPGIGKTTLAHIIARHAGYRPVEVNGSDDRSASVLKQVIFRAMESSTLVLERKDGSKDPMAGRPNCVILDEIDGADAKGAIAALVEIIRAEIPPPGQKKRKQSRYLRRPIIFICNHKYATALRPLLAYCRQFNVDPPDNHRLVSRLRAILKTEGLSISRGCQLLHQLVSVSGGDIRSCLFTLQCAATVARENATVSTVDISYALERALRGDGLKDVRTDLAGTVVSIFKHSKDKRGRDSMDQARRAVEGYGDYSKTIDCLFTNVLQVPYVDPSLDRCVLAHDLLGGADLYRSYTSSVAMTNSMEFNAMQILHMPTAAMAVHLLCRVNNRPQLTYGTREMTENHFSRLGNLGLVAKFKDGICLQSRCSNAATIEQIIPFALWILSASRLGRAVSSIDVLDKTERQAFNDHVQTLKALGLTYIASDKKPQETSRHYGANKRRIDNTVQKIMILEPEIDRLVDFKGCNLERHQRRRNIPTQLKELLAHHALLQGMKEREMAHSSIVNSKKPLAMTRKRGRGQDDGGTSPLAPAKQPLKKKRKMNFLGIGAQKARAARSARKAASVGLKASGKLSHSGSGMPLDRVARFKFQKGFTEAVRMPCHMKDFL